MTLRFSSLAGLSMLAACAPLHFMSAQESKVIADSNGNELHAEQETLRVLVQMNLDAAAIYDEARLAARNVSLRNEIRLLIDRRLRLADTLQEHAKELDGASLEGLLPSTDAADRMRSFVENDSLTAAQQVYRSESVIIEKYERVLSTPLSGETEALIKKDLLASRASRRRINEIRAEIQASNDFN